MFVLHCKRKCFTSGTLIPIRISLGKSSLFSRWTYQGPQLLLRPVCPASCPPDLSSWVPLRSLHHPLPQSYPLPVLKGPTRPYCHAGHLGVIRDLATGSHQDPTSTLSLFPELGTWPHPHPLHVVQASSHPLGFIPAPSSQHHFP